MMLKNLGYGRTDRNSRSMDQLTPWRSSNSAFLLHTQEQCIRVSDHKKLLDAPRREGRQASRQPSGASSPIWFHRGGCNHVSTNCAYPQRNGHAELAWVACYIGRRFLRARRVLPIPLLTRLNVEQLIDRDQCITAKTKWTRWLASSVPHLWQGLQCRQYRYRSGHGQRRLLSPSLAPTSSIPHSLAPYCLFTRTIS